MRKYEKLDATVEFARRVLMAAMSDPCDLRQDEVLAAGMELGLIKLRKVTRVEAEDFNLEPGAQVYDFQPWIEPKRID